MAVLTEAVRNIWKQEIVGKGGIRVKLDYVARIVLIQ